MSCPLKCYKTSQDDQEHILFCQSIFEQLKDTETKAAQEILYKDIYGYLTIKRGVLPYLQGF